MSKYYRYRFSDLTKIQREEYTYYSMEDLTNNVTFEMFDDYYDEWLDGTWFVYRGDSCMSCKPMSCETEQEAYENLLESLNNSLYEYWHDL